MAITTSGKLYNFPAQKKAFNEKTDDWGIENIEAGISIIDGDHSRIRKSNKLKKVNYDLVNGIMDMSDLEQAFNPMGIKGVKFPTKLQNYPIEIPKLSVLKGEEARRRFDWRIRSTNEDAISTKEETLRQQIHGLLMDEIQSQEYSEELAMRRMQKMDHYQKYEFQDYMELTGTRIMEYFWYTQKIRDIHSSMFWDVLIGGEEICAVDIIHGEPQMNKKHPMNISNMGSGDSVKIEDSDIIIDDGYYPVGKIIDDFWDVLSPDEIDGLEDGNTRNRRADRGIMGPLDMGQESQYMNESQLITVDNNDVRSFGGWFDSDGNVRVTRVVWRSRRKIGELSYLDPNGVEQVTIVDEAFPVDMIKMYGWKIKWHWINEWWQGYKIGADMYKKIEPLPRIGSKMSNPSFCLPPYVGTIYSIGGGESVSLMDRIRPYKYLYNVYMARTELASARNKGVIAELDLAEIPDGWDEELVMMFAEANGYMIKDSFSEGKKGIAQGKLIGSLKQRGNDVLNLNSSDVIRANLELARYVKIELGEIAGISPQREGQIDNRETYGGVERSVTQSSHITEEWFMLHDQTKIRSMELMIETAKYAWRNATGENKKKLQYNDDGLITHIFTVDGREFAESEYGYYISNGQNDTMLIQSIQNLAQAGLQNDKLTFSDLFSIYRDTSVSSVIRKIEHGEEKREQQINDARKEDIEQRREAADAMMEIEMMRMEQDFRIANGKIEADIYIAELDIQARMAELEAKIPEDNDNSGQMRHEIEKLKMQIDQKKKEMTEKSKQFYDKLKLEKDKLNRQIQSSEKIARMSRNRQNIKK